jgi:hypothetical protein
MGRREPLKDNSEKKTNSSETAKRDSDYQQWQQRLWDEMK